jgi:hypothetical protein
MKNDLTQLEYGLWNRTHESNKAGYTIADYAITAFCIIVGVTPLALALARAYTYLYL